MRQVLRAMRLDGVMAMAVAILVAGAGTSALAAPPPTVDLPPCAAGRIVNPGDGTLSLSNCTIIGNTTTDAGGGVENYGTLDLTNVLISGNTAGSGGGGGIYNRGNLILTNVIISGNTTAGPGGGVYNDRGAVFMNDVTMSGNTAGGSGGGGIANIGGAAIGAHVALTQNQTTAGDGGGLLNDASLCLSAGDDFNVCFDAPSGGNSLIQDNHAAGNGGGVANTGSLVLSDTTVDQNHADSGNGGGVSNASGSIQLLDVTISSNTATGNGGGLFNTTGGSVCCAVRGGFYAFNLTIAGNHATGTGGAVYSDDGAYTALASATIADNTATGNGGVVNDDASFPFTELQDTLLARNGGVNCGGDIYSDGHNLDSGFTCGFSAVGDRSGVPDGQLGLGTLDANGGPMQGSAFQSAPMLTLKLDALSPAVDGGSDSCPATDERGTTRPQRNACDIGAFELEPGSTTTVTVSITAANKVYDATPDATISTCTVNGASPGADVSCVASNGSFDTANVGAGKPVTATVALSGAAASDYELSSTTAHATADISPAPAVVTPDAASKTYGAADPTFTGTVSGFYGADSNVTATYARTPGETVAGGPYPISATLSPGGALANYDITYNTANFTITKATASVTPNAATKVYGAADPAFNGSLVGFLAADGVTAAYSRTAGETVAGSPYTISATLSPAGALPNYTIAYNTAPFTITAALSLACSAATGQVGVPHTSAVVVSGGVAPSIVSMANGSLPPGLVLNANGSITGTPTTTGSFSFSVRTVDGNGSSATATGCGITIAAPSVSMFVIGDAEAHSIGSVVNFWGAQWWKNNLMTGAVGNGVASFKGFADQSDNRCGGTWTSRPGNSSKPPDTIPDYVAIIVTDSVEKSGSSISGHIKQILIVRQDGTYEPNPGHDANGTVVSIACDAYVTNTQASWDVAASGRNAGMLLANNFAAAYPQGVTIGGAPYSLKFTSVAAIRAFLPAGGQAGVLTMSATNPTSSSAKVFAGNVLSLQLAVDFSTRGFTTSGLSSLKVSPGHPMAGSSVAQVLAVANQVLAGNTSALPAGMSVSSLNDVISSLNQNFDGGTTNNGLLAQ